jgi:hypothetical protein
VNCGAWIKNNNPVGNLASPRGSWPANAHSEESRLKNGRPFHGTPVYLSIVALNQADRVSCRKPARVSYSPS